MIVLCSNNHTVFYCVLLFINCCSFKISKYLLKEPGSHTLLKLKLNNLMRINNFMYLGNYTNKNNAIFVTYLHNY